MLIRWRTLALSLTGSLGMVVAAAPAQADEPLARFESAVCPGVAGLKREAAETVVGRIRANAEALGLRLAPDGDCDPNILLVMVDDGQAFLERLKDDRSYLFAEITRPERVALMNSTGPVRVFLRTRDFSRDGMPIPRRETLTQIPQTEMWMAHSKIYSATRRDIHTALVLVDRAAVGGLSLDQLADYATFRSLAKTLPQAGSQESILTLFDGEGARPGQLTQFDRAFLGELYSGIPNLPGSARIAELEHATRAVVAE